MSLEITDSTYAVPQIAFPIEVELTDTLFFKLAVDSTATQLDISASACYATTTSDPDDTLRHNLIENE